MNPETISPLLERSGFNAWGVVSAGRYDELVPSAWRTSLLLPGARAAVLLATGGPAFFRAAVGRRSGDRSEESDPLDAFSALVVEGVCAEWRRRGWRTEAFHYFERRGTGDGQGDPMDPPGDYADSPGDYADFVALGRACGLGTPSRLGLLLHPRFGPWFAIRALMLTERPLVPTPAIPGPGPCDGCPAPCASACPVAAPRAAGFDRGACRAHREATPVCRTRCDARRACVVGPEHAYSEAAEAHQMADPAGIQALVSPRTCR